MKYIKTIKSSLFLKVIVLTLLCQSVHAYTINPKERISFWRENFTMLSEEEEVNVSKAKAVFNRLVRVTGIRSGVLPRLHIIKSAPDHLSLPISIPDGWIIISKKTLDFAYEESDNGDDILAFILAHEIAHQMEDDFWHMKYFQIIDRYADTDKSAEQADLKRISYDANKIMAKELKADEQGLTITAMAGFNTGSILDYGSNQGFFKQWISRHANAGLLSSSTSSTTHPTPAQRETAIYSRLKQIEHQSILFKLGLWHYQAADYRAAKDSFEEFRYYFPGRAINHNIALSFHQLALQSLPVNSQAVFKTTLSIDPYTYAFQVNRGSKSNTETFNQLIQSALEFYELSLSQDKHYIQSYYNLSSAYLLSNKPYKAIALLVEATKTYPEDIKIINNLAIAFYMTGNRQKSKELFNTGFTLDNKNTDILYNLGLLYSFDNNRDRAEVYWNDYLTTHPHSGWARLINKALNRNYKPQHFSLRSIETLENLQVGNYQDEIPESWMIESESRLIVNNHSYLIVNYKNGLICILEDDEILYLTTNKNYKGSSSAGIKIDDSMSTLISKYGTPDEIQDLNNDENFIYRARGISFLIKDLKVHSWMVFRS